MAAIAELPKSFPGLKGIVRLKVASPLTGVGHPRLNPAMHPNQQ